MTFSFTTFILAAVCAGTAFAKVTPSEMRIVGGEVSTDFIPNQVALYISGTFSCGGSLISQKCVLTAAHCAKGRDVSTLKIRAGIRKLNSTGGGTRLISKAIVHPNYSTTTLTSDAAILVLNAPINRTNTGIILLNSDPLYEGDVLTVSGWGLTTETGTTVSNELRSVQVPAIGFNSCNATYGGGLTSTMFCAGVTTGGKDSCSGDSGGPIVKDGKQYGIVSWGYGCARAGYPGVYTSVRQILPWIKKIMAANC